VLVLHIPTVSYSIPQQCRKAGVFPLAQGLCSGSAGAGEPAADHQTGSGHTGRRGAGAGQWEVASVFSSEKSWEKGGKSEKDVPRKGSGSCIVGGWRMMFDVSEKL